MAASGPWYRDGLRFECSRCGACCAGEPGYVWITREEITALAGLLGIDEEELARRYLRRVGRRLSLIEKPGGACVFYDDGCTVYEVRPRQCRTFPFWAENLESRRAWTDAQRACPGVDSGRLYSLERIAALRRGEGETGPEPDAAAHLMKTRRQARDRAR